MFSVYILFSKKLGRFYKGQTSNLTDRIKRHNSGYEKSTSPGVPWILVWTTMKDSRSEALNLESKLKNLSAKRLVDFMKNYHSDLTQDGGCLLKQFEP